MGTDTLRIGCGCGFWGDTAEGPAQLVRSGAIEVLVLDYLSEITMSLLARARQKRADLGYTTDFVTDVMRPLAQEIAQRRIKVVTNAGGVNPQGCRDALQTVLDGLGVKLSVAVVSGDDVTNIVSDLREAGVTDLQTGRPLPANTVSANAYLGAFPIARALNCGADVVVTGRCVDSALALGPLINQFGWSETDFDRLAQGSLAGHIIECGTQATGGVFTDWGAVADDWADMGFPIVECSPDGSFVVTKPAGTGGMVTAATVAEQVTYEVHDPSAYMLPDVVCDWTDVRLQDLGGNQVQVTGARGRAPTGHYKASLTYQDGFRCVATLMIVGREARARAQRVAEGILTRTRRLLAGRSYGDYSATSVEVLGAESMYGPHAEASGSREVILKIAVAHSDQRALELFAREIFPAATSMAQSITGFAGGRPGVQPVVRLASCLVPKSSVPVEIEVNRRREKYATTEMHARTEMHVRAETHAPAGIAREARTATSGDPYPDPPRLEWAKVPLIRLAWARSGDKGDTANIGVIARRREFVLPIAAALTAGAVRSWLAHLVEGDVERFDWPGINGWSFVLHRALGGGGVASLRYDPQGKSYAQILLDFPVPVPLEWLQPGGFLHV